MKCNICILIKSITLLVVTLSIAFSTSTCTKIEQPIVSITMTTTATQVRIIMSGSEDIVINWGNGKNSSLNEGTLLNFSEGFEFYHTYPFATSRKIIITGKVETLRCDNMQLTALDVSQNVELKSLVCHNNKLTELDVSKNLALTSLIFSDNQLTSLDVSKNTLLEELHLGGNRITTIDVSRNNALKYLTCSNNPIAIIDVSANSELIILNLNRCMLAKLDLSKNTRLNSLCIKGNLFTASALNDLFKTMFYVPQGHYAFIDYTENPGSNDPDHSIWEEKNWLFHPCR